MHPRLKNSAMPIQPRERALHPSLSPIGVLVFVLGLVGSIAAHAEVISVPSERSSSTAAALPPPTVLRGSPPSTAKSVPGCPPGYTVAPDYGCLAPSTGDYPSGALDYGYWPDYGWGWGYGYGGFPFFRRSHGFAKFRGFRHFGHFAGVHRFARFHGFSAGAGHMGGFSRRKTARRVRQWSTTVCGDLSRLGLRRQLGDDLQPEQHCGRLQ